jgi:hypothetical protein
MADPDDIMVIAHHEAGHAVVARALGIEVTTINCGEVCTRWDWIGRVAAAAQYLARIGSV